MWLLQYRDRVQFKHESGNRFLLQCVESTICGGEVFDSIYFAYIVPR